MRYFQQNSLFRHFIFQVGDLIGVAGNHWNGFGKGTNKRTNQVMFLEHYFVSVAVGSVFVWLLFCGILMITTLFWRAGLMYKKKFLFFFRCYRMVWYHGTKPTIILFYIHSRSTKKCHCTKRRKHRPMKKRSQCLDLVTERL